MMVVSYSSSRFLAVVLLYWWDEGNVYTKHFVTHVFGFTVFPLGDGKYKKSIMGAFE